MRLMKWLVTVTATVAVFGVCLWLFRFASWSWLPNKNDASNRWLVATAFASVTAGAVGAVGTWLAGRETPRRAGTADAGGAAAGLGGPAAGERSITAGGNIPGIANTGDGATNIQR